MKPCLLADLPLPSGVRPGSATRRLPWLVCLLSSCLPLVGAVPHPDRPDRLVEIREGRSVEYSPGQEAWMEMAFSQMEAEDREPVARPPSISPEERAFPGTARDLRERRDALLAAVARQIGLPAATELQGRTFDTFLGYYELLTEVMRSYADAFPTIASPHRLAIWQRDDLVARLRAGAQIPGLSYDPATDSGRFEYRWNADSGSPNERLVSIHAAIEAQRLNHTFDYGQGTAKASVSLRAPAKTAKTSAKPDAPTEKPAAAELVIPIIYRGDPATPPTPAAFATMVPQLRAAMTAVAQQASRYRDATVVSIILHETAEIGLVENIITSRDRRWLCEGTANYVAWRVSRNLFGAEFAAQVYNLDAQLRLFAPQQPRINLARWSAVENAKDKDVDEKLNRAHYAFATRAMFLLAGRHGDDALFQLWTDVARTPKKKVAAKTFATAYRKRFKVDLDTLIAEAEKLPIPASFPPVK
jgi:hypothetical protein